MGSQGALNKVHKDTLLLIPNLSGSEPLCSNLYVQGKGRGQRSEVRPVKSEKPGSNRGGARRLQKGSARATPLN